VRLLDVRRVVQADADEPCPARDDGQEGDLVERDRVAALGIAWSPSIRTRQLAAVVDYRRALQAFIAITR